MAETPLEEGWQAELERWMQPFQACLHHAHPRHWAPVYLRGLIGPGERKSTTCLAQQVAPGEQDQLNHFIAHSPWAVEPAQKVLIDQANALVGGHKAHLIVDDLGWPKKGEHSVGVAPQWCGALGKKANCQVAVSLTLAGGEVPVPIALRLYLPESWAHDPARRDEVGVPEAVQFEPKWRIALMEIRRAKAAGARFGDVLGDAEYGKVAEFRLGLEDMGLRYALGIGPDQRVYPARVRLGRRRPNPHGGARPVHPQPSAAALSAQAMIASLGRKAWHRLCWRMGTKGKLACRWAAVRVRVADGDWLSGGQRLPGELVWLVCEWRDSGEKKYYLSNLPRRASKKRLAGTIKGRWACEQGHQQMKEELGLDHYEGRSWQGLHHHLFLTMVALAFLQHLRLKGQKKGPWRAAAARPQNPACPRCGASLLSAAG
jgi:SRSO17 transposase